MAAVQEVVAEKKPVVKAPKPDLPIPVSRRFEIPDLERHGLWLVPRLLEAYPHLNQIQLVGFLRSAVYNNEFLFLCQDNAVALAQTMSEQTLQPRQIIWERFVFCKDPENPEHVRQAAAFYGDIANWARRKNIEYVVVDQNTDVSFEQMGEYMPQIRPSEIHLARIELKVPS